MRPHKGGRRTRVRRFWRTWQWLALRQGRHPVYWSTWAWWKTWWTAPDLNAPWEDIGQFAAYVWAVNYSPARPRDDDVYATVLNYAERNYDQSIKLAESYDKKLDDLMKSVMAVGAIIATAVRFLADGNKATMSTPLIMSFALLVTSAALTVVARSKTQMGFPMSAQALLEIVERQKPPKANILPRLIIGGAEMLPTKGEADAVASASYHYATTMTARANFWKSKQFNRAAWLFYLAMFPLIITLVGNLATFAAKH